MVHRHLLAGVVAALVASAPAFAFAETKLVSSMPANGGSAQKLARIELRFDAPIGPAKPAVELVMTAMPGMAHHDPMRIAGFDPALSADGKTLVIALPRPLPAGDYRLAWRGAGAQSPLAGKITFTAK